MNRTERLFKFLEYKDITYAEYASTVNVKRQQVANWKSNFMPVPDKYVVRTCEEFHELNPRWLIYEAGEMIDEGYIPDDMIEELKENLRKEIYEELKSTQVEIKKAYDEVIKMKDAVIDAKDKNIKLLEKLVNA